MYTPKPVSIACWVNKPVATPDPIRARIGANEEVVWRCHVCAAEIDFPYGCPFESKHFVVPKGGAVCSGPPKEDTAGEYKYVVSITLPDGRKSEEDPKVIIEGPNP